MTNYRATEEELADEIRDWAGLPTDILNLIISRLYFPTEISRFRGVCTAWRSIPAPLVRSQWLMSKPLVGTRLNFFHPLYCKPYSMEIPELGFAKVRFSKDGWLLMSDRDVHFFYNPFTRAKVELPDLPKGYNRFRVMTFTAPPTSSDCAVFGVDPLFDEEDIMSVFVGVEGFKRGAKISVFRLDRLKMEWQEIEELGDKMLFLSDSTCLSATSHIPGMENKIYFPKLPRLHGRYGVFYSLATGMHQTFGNDFSSTNLGDTRELLNCSWIEPRDYTYSETELDWLKNS
ncbi:hypothetical protein RJ639_006648 [Escallonia herrerae]|uniref:KIB1-4 beta-propeller domain-containing protein n=1 Tax=Escallonia herrerae TaxID=1293975 RepID=A0AA89AZZ0_9ASTE|nr:hypothetical protein RJ639_024396 [Escallonia herrerae]KAK3017581.1 hypothetical protein RJ639_006648 [Escallonia herrerae]